MFYFALAFVVIVFLILALPLVEWINSKTELNHSHARARLADAGLPDK